uniref:Uncharacterized protein n=2 Tax=Schizaphis graminum TaxID=13262 RepID=A0A2S2ND66_SCHGA
MCQNRKFISTDICLKYPSQFIIIIIFFLIIIIVIYCLYSLYNFTRFLPMLFDVGLSHRYYSLLYLMFWPFEISTVILSNWRHARRNIKIHFFWTFEIVIVILVIANTRNKISKYIFFYTFLSTYSYCHQLADNLFYFKFCKF